MAGKPLIIGLAMLSFALANVGVAQAETVVATNSNAITVNDAANATPYPSTLNVEGADGNIADVNVTITLSHTNPDDLDIAIVSPDGSSEILMSDVCGGADLVGRTLTFDSEAGSGAAPVSGPCPAASYTASNDGVGDNWPAPGPGSLTTNQLTNFDGEDSNGVWRLFVIDDAGTDAGSIASWGVTIVTTPADIVIPAAGTGGLAGPYPSAKTFATPPGKVISDADFQVDDFNHLHPDDVDMLLQGPGGQAVMLMSDACGSSDTHDSNWIFDDEAPALMGDNDPSECNPVAVKPSDFGDSESLPAPAPQRPYSAALSTFDGFQSADWSLFVNDDASSDTGFINGWSMVLTTRDAATVRFASAAAAGTEGETLMLEVIRSGAAPAALGPATVDVAVSHIGSTASDLGDVPTLVQFARGEATQTIAVPLAADGAAEPEESFSVTISAPTGDAGLAGTSSSAVRIAPSSATTPSNLFTLGKAKKLPNGSAELPITVPGAGTLSAVDAATPAKRAAAKTKALIKPRSISVPAASTVVLKLKPSKVAKKRLKKGKKVKLTVAVTYTPTGGSARTNETPLKLKKKPAG